MSTVAAVLLVRRLRLLLGGTPVRRPDRAGAPRPLLEQVDVRPGDLEDEFPVGTESGALSCVLRDEVVLPAGVEPEAFEIDVDALGRAAHAGEGEVGSCAFELPLSREPPVHDVRAVGEPQVAAGVAVLVQGSVVGDLHPVAQCGEEPCLQVGLDLRVQPDQPGVLHIADVPAVLAVPLEQQGFEHRQRCLPRDHVLELFGGVAVQAAMAGPALFLGAGACLELLVGPGEGVTEGIPVGEAVQISGAAGQRVEQNEEPAALSAVVVRHGRHRGVQVLRVAAEVQVHAEPQGGTEGVHLGIHVRGRGRDQYPQRLRLQLMGEQYRLLRGAVLLTTPQRTPRAVVLELRRPGRC